jgi:hypothetical protein
MKTKGNRRHLLETARAIANQLKQRCEGTRLHIRIPARARATYTDGWSAVIGNLGKKQPRLEIWLDRFSSHSNRKFWACFASDEHRQPIIEINKHASKKLGTVRTITLKDTTDGKFFFTDQTPPPFGI